MPKRKSRLKEESSYYITREIIAAVLFTIGVFSSLSLLFYSSKSELSVRGAMGTIGVFIADMLGNTFGLCSFVIPIVMFYTAAVVFTNRAGSRLYQKAFSAFVFLFASTTILALIFKNKEFLGYKPAGGWLGSFLSAILSGIAGAIGSYIVVTVFLLISLIIVSNVTLSEILGELGRVLMFITDGIASAWGLALRQGERVIEGLYDLFAKPAIQVKQTPVQNEERPAPIIAKEGPPSEPELKDTNFPQIIIEEPREKSGGKPPTKPIMRTNFKLPPVDLLDPKRDSEIKFDKDAAYEKAKLIEEKLSDFGVSGKVTEIRPGPVITMFEYKPAPGIKINKIAALTGDLAMGLSALSVRMERKLLELRFQTPKEKRLCSGNSLRIENSAIANQSSRLPWEKTFLGNPSTWI